MRELVRRLVLSTPERRSRRVRPRPSRRAAGPAAHRPRGPAHRRRPGAAGPRPRRSRPRRLVLLCDVSGSMEPYTRVYLTLLQGAVAGARAEAFVFSTRLTRLTRRAVGPRPRPGARARRRRGAGLGRRHAARPRASAGSSTDYGRRGHGPRRRGRVLSDGWATDEPEEVAEEMRRLRRLAYRVVWVNPRKAAPGYAPLVAGMAAALPYCDAFVSGHSLAALEQVVAAVAEERAGNHGDGWDDATADGTSASPFRHTGP